MATRNRTLVYRKYRDALKSVRAPTSSSASSSGAGGGPVIELVSTSLLNPNRNYAPLSTEDPDDRNMMIIHVSCQMFNERQMAKIKKNEAFTAEREREIQQASEDLFVVVESVNELAQIMKDLSVLVIDQGTIVDRIDYNIQNVASTVDEGLKQLQKAERTQKQGGMVMCATVLVIMCFVMLVLLILKEIFF
ncbi:hypothetical protein C1H46_044433 [Malus baccata]|uniref:t-SNARE coiled-coil homology domain-containing protein n=1 Tax=Malus baccata TaxID=106549 RepID=A0A540K730_MALBA|nr:hypothetical protein C1H46_044433 [Malus baccata]